MRIKLINNLKRQDIIFFVFAVLLYLFMPFRLLQFFFLFYAVIKAAAFLISLIIPSLLGASRKDDIVYSNIKEPFRVRVDVFGKGLFGINRVLFTDSIGNFHTDANNSFLVNLTAGKSQTILYRARRLERGKYRIGPLRAEGAEPFGFFTWHKKIEAFLPVIIYPIVHDMDFPQKIGLPSGNIRVANKLYEDLTQFRSVREYIPGDEMKRINWKISARMGKLFSMEYVPSIYFPVLILLNLCENDYPLTQRSILIERAVETAASLVFFYVGLKQEVGMISTGRAEDSVDCFTADVKAGYGHAVNILEMLAVIQASKEHADFTRFVFQSGVHIPTGTKIVVVSPPLKESQIKGVLGIRRKGYDTELYTVSSYAVKKTREQSLPGVRSFKVDGQGREFAHG